MMGTLMVLPFMVSCGNICAKLFNMTPYLAEGNAWQVRYAQEMGKRYFLKYHYIQLHIIHVMTLINQAKYALSCCNMLTILLATA
jgi:hypothetical protein